MTIVILVVVPLVMVAGALQLKALTSHATSNKKQLETAGKLAVDSIEHIRTVASLTIEENFYEQYRDEVRKPYKYVCTCANIVSNELNFYFYIMIIIPVY